MNILYIIDNRFVPQAAASMTSLCENNRSVPEIQFYILSLHVTERNKEKLRRYIQLYSSAQQIRGMHIIEIETVQQYFDFSFDTSAWNPIVLVRMQLDRFLPKSVHRVLYMDGDTIVRQNLEELWRTDLGECAIGACMEPTCSKKRKEALGLKGLPYYNAGILLIDLDNWRKNRTGESVLDYYRANNGRLFANDQDAINASQKGRIYSLSITYNYHNTYDIYRYRLLEKYCDYPVPMKKDFLKIKSDPAIVHFLGEDRPWRKGSTHRFAAEYRHYVEMTPWKGEDAEDGWQFYFLCWRLFNFFMKPFPVLRCNIMDFLIPIALKKKSKLRS